MLKFILLKTEDVVTNPENTRIKPEKITLNDIGFRLILIPFFGIAIPLLTRMIAYQTFSLPKTKLAFIYSILIAFVIWHGNRFLLFTLRTYFNWFEKPLRKVLALILTVPFFTLPASALMLYGYYQFFEAGRVDWEKIKVISLIILIAVLFIVHAYETAFTVKEAESEKIKRAETEKVRAEAELEALKSQIDPHFIFNSLNTLSYLISESPARARDFNEALADVYRYILQNKAKDMVVLSEEVAFLENYYAMIRIRFEKAVRLRVDIPPEALEAYLIPPISLQAMLENAIKHNLFNDKNPLTMHMVLTEGGVRAVNNLCKKTQEKPVSGTGLKNLGERYRLVTGHALRVKSSDKEFSVHLPLIPF